MRRCSATYIAVVRHLWVAFSLPGSQTRAWRTPLPAPPSTRRPPQSMHEREAGGSLLTGLQEPTRTGAHLPVPRRPPPHLLQKDQLTPPRLARLGGVRLEEAPSYKVAPRALRLPLAISSGALGVDVGQAAVPGGRG